MTPWGGDFLCHSFSMQVAALFAGFKGRIFQTEGYCELSLRLLI